MFQLLKSIIKYYALCMVPAARELEMIKLFRSLVRDTRARATGISCFPYQTTTGASCVTPILPLFLPRAPRLQDAFSHEIAHMQEVVCNEHGIGGDGEYCGDNYA
jgi:hypothetical protein